MRISSRTLAVIAVAVVTASVACSSSSSEGGGTGGSGTVTFSCYVASQSLCTQILAPPSAVSSEQSTCTNMEQGTPGTGCLTTGLVGCCKLGGSSDEEQCYYSAEEASTGMAACTGAGVSWSTTP
jgi:hypothetical protein